MAQLSQRLDKEILFSSFEMMSRKLCNFLVIKQVGVETRQFDINAKDPAMMVDPPEVTNFLKIALKEGAILEE